MLWRIPSLGRPRAAARGSFLPPAPTSLAAAQTQTRSSTRSNSPAETWKHGCGRSYRRSELPGAALLCGRLPGEGPGVQDAAERQRQARGGHGVVEDFERHYSHYMRYSLKWDWKCCHLRKENNLGKKPAFGPFGNLLHFQNQVVRQRHPATRRQQEVPRLLPDAGMRCHAFLVSLGSRVTATATREKEEKKVREWRKAQAKQLSCLDSTEFSCEAFAKKLLMRISFYIISTNLGFIHHGIFCDGCSDGEEWRQAFKSRDFVQK